MRLETVDRMDDGRAFPHRRVREASRGERNALEEYAATTNGRAMSVKMGVSVTQEELSQLVARVMMDPKIKSCNACNLHDGQVEERHRPEGPKLSRVARPRWIPPVHADL